MRRIAAIALAALLTPCLSARAGLILSIESTTVQANSTGNSFDVTLTNTGPTAIDNIIGFTFVIQASNSNISFVNAASSVTIDTADPYIFASNSFFGPWIGFSSDPQTISATDGGYGGRILAANTTVGLGHVFFNAGSATGVTMLSFLSGFPNTFVNASGHALDLTLNTGSIDVKAPFTATPEPSSLAMAGGAVLIGGGAWWRKRRRSVNA
jgi:hypothetical protein